MNHWTSSLSSYGHYSIGPRDWKDPPRLWMRCKSHSRTNLENLSIDGRGLSPPRRQDLEWTRQWDRQRLWKTTLASLTARSRGKRRWHKGSGSSTSSRSAGSSL